MDAILVGRDACSGRLEGVPEAYRPIPHCKRRDGHCTKPFSERLRRERGGSEHAGAPPGHAAANTSPRRASMAASTTGRVSAPARQRLERAHAHDRQPARLRQRARRRDPDPQAGEAARADADREPVERRPSPRPPPPAPPPAAASSRPACAGRTPGAGSSRTSKTASSTRTPATVEGVAVSSPSTITTTAPAGRRPRARAPRAARPAARPAARRARAARATRRT